VDRNGQLRLPITVPLEVHPETARAVARGDLAERMVDVATDLALLVRDEGREAIGEFLGQYSSEEKDALLVVLAAMAPVEERSAADMLGWVGFDEFGNEAGSAFPKLYEDCGTQQAFHRHKFHGHLATQIEACGCAQAGRDYFAARNAAKRAAGGAAAGEAVEAA
jgi:hypothetical protein